MLSSHLRICRATQFAEAASLRPMDFIQSYTKPTASFQLALSTMEVIEHKTTAKSTTIKTATTTTKKQKQQKDKSTIESTRAEQAPMKTTNTAKITVILKTKQY